jgi:hypothetical protein
MNDRATIQPHERSQFKDRLRQARESDGLAWERSRCLVRAQELPTTLKRLCSAIRDSSLPPTLSEALLKCLPDPEGTRIRDLPADRLKELTGLPATKALRALCVLFGLTQASTESLASTMPSSAIEEFIHQHPNPYDLLLQAEVASLLDLGAGDLSFEEELIDQFWPRVMQRGMRLVLHAVDRLQPGSRLGGPLHAPRARLDKLATLDPDHLEFRFWGEQDMFALEDNPEIWPTYTIVTCHAPANPTFAYEPSRLTNDVVTAHLRRMKGDFRKVRIEGEAALEVLHGGKSLLFPPWKFDIRGPLALLDLLSRRGKLAVLTSIDTEVFWELLSQLIADERVRPNDTILTPEVIPDLFGRIHARLITLPIGQPISLAELTDIRQDLPRVLQPVIGDRSSYAYRAVIIRRGATFPETPASLTARVIKDMKQERVPWCVLLVP